MKKWIALVCAVALWQGVVAQEPKPAEKKAEKAKRPPLEAFTDAAKAGPDFAVQGEYVAELPDGTKIGCQVVADGDGKYSGKSYQGGLPGDGWDGRTTWPHTGKTENGVVTIESDEAKATYANGKIECVLHSGDKVTFTRVVRKSSTEGMKPPTGAVVLFDGTNANAWDKGEVVEGNLLKMGVNTKQKFGDCTLHIEFRTPFMPKARGQSRGNSGVYMGGSYEVQILDSFGLDGKNNECGGLYELADPSVNMCYPPLQWQTYDIDYRAPRFGADGKKSADARITVKHNGVLIHDDVSVPRDTRAAVLKEAATGPIHLQNHGNPVVYRNVWVVEKK